MRQPSHRGVSGCRDIFAPQQRSGLKIDLIMEETLVLVTSDPNGTLKGAAD